MAEKKTDDQVTTISSLKDVVHPADMPPNRADSTDSRATSTVTMSSGAKVTGPTEVVNRLKK